MPSFSSVSFLVTKGMRVANQVGLQLFHIKAILQLDSPAITPSGSVSMSGT